MKVLFVCKANVGRSQMAEAYHNHLAKLRKLENKADSAGTRVFERAGLSLDKLINKVNGIENVILAMSDLGIDVSKNKLKQLSEDLLNNYDKIIVMAEPETWPEYLKNNRKVEYWQIENPKDTSLETHKKVRDKIINKINEMLG